MRKRRHGDRGAGDVANTASDPVILADLALQTEGHREVLETCVNVINDSNSLLRDS